MVDIYRIEDEITIKRSERYVNGEWENVRYPSIENPIIITGLTDEQLKSIIKMLFQ